MNHLAHLLLSCDNDDIRLGNFIADYLSNKAVSAYSASIQQGIYLHRQIDNYTDTHAAIGRIKVILREKHRRYAPVIIDVYADYLLIQHWDEYVEEPLPVFTQRMYALLLARQSELPLILQSNIQRMVADNWLMRYGTYEGLDRTLRHLGRRSSRPDWFEGAADSLFSNYEAINAEFEIFFPTLMAFVNEQCSSMATESD